MISSNVIPVDDTCSSRSCYIYTSHLRTLIRWANGFVKLVSAFLNDSLKFPSGDLAAIESVEGPHHMDIVSLEHIRTLLVKCTPLKQSQFKHAKITVPEDLRAYFKRPESYADFAATVKSVFVEYDEENGNLLLSTFEEQAVKRATILSDMYFKDSRQKMQLLQRQECKQRKEYRLKLSTTSYNRTDSFVESLKEC
ncbi:unnamed protein product [Brugia timori]|uniref:Synaptic functional regulator FMRP KH0 domain-containing protein n=1 Tax=Brugia timori TaxID=42155 RepID=A0A3P7U4N3_9BILA|nr:unnamed protein product [Brugia timori]